MTTGPYTITAYIGRRGASNPADALSYEFVVDGKTIATGEVCSSRNPNKLCTVAAANREKVYEPERDSAHEREFDVIHALLPRCARFAEFAYIELHWSTSN